MVETFAHFGVQLPVDKDSGDPPMVCMVQVMEDGGIDLHDEVEKRKGSSHLTRGDDLVFIAGWTKAVAEGLNAIHEQDAIHRDVKPSNILVKTKDDELVECKLCDIGGARNDDKEDESKNMADHVGTAGYQAPELVNRQNYDKRVDYYSLGATLHKVSGRIPLEGVTSMPLTSFSTLISP